MLRITKKFLFGLFVVVGLAWLLWYWYTRPRFFPPFHVISGECAVSVVIFTAGNQPVAQVQLKDDVHWVAGDQVEGTECTSGLMLNLHAPTMYVVRQAKKK